MLEQRQLLAGDLNHTTGDEIRTYRLAIASTAEFTALNGGVAQTQAVLDTLVADLNAIYRPELAIEFQLVGPGAGGNPLIFTDAASDGLTDGNLSAIINESTGVIDSVLGSSSSKDALPGDVKYDLGHVLGTNGGASGSSGLAYLGIVGDFDDFFFNDLGLRAGAGTITGTTSSVNSIGWTQVVAHEIGHQFDSDHTFNALEPGSNCTVDQRASGNAYEPASGSTLMSYAGICGASNLQTEEDPVFHSSNFEQINDFINGSFPSRDPSPFLVTASGNAIPTVDATPGDANVPTTTTTTSATSVGSAPTYVIPTGTPFELSAVGNDADGDSLTYTWEQLDLGAADSLPLSGNADGPLFRTFAPSTTGANRVFPNLPDLLAGNDTSASGEVLPLTARELNFRSTVRDGVGGVNSDDIKLEVVDNGSAFTVDAVPASVPGGSTQTITWNVAGTDGGAIGATDVEIWLSTDGGSNFNTLLATTTNDGSADVAIPNIDSSGGRIKIQPVGNVFFNVNDADFSIVASSGAPGVTLLQTAAQVSEAGVVDGVTTTSYDLKLNTVPTAPVELTVSAGSEVEVSADGVTYAATAVLSLADDSATAVFVRAIDDSDAEGLESVVLTHAITASSDANYPTSLVISDVEVTVVDDERHPIIGVEFSNDGANPTNWNEVSAAFSSTQSNLVREDGLATTIGLEVGYQSGASNGLGVSTTPNVIPIHTPSLTDLNGYRLSSGVQDFDWTGLQPGSSYDVYVFLTENFSDEVDQTVTISGDAATETFTMDTAGRNRQLHVNGDAPSSTAPIEDSAIRMVADANGEIRVSVSKNSGNFAFVSGLGLQPVADAPPPIVPLTVTNLNSGNQYFENGGQANLRIQRGGDVTNSLTIDVMVDLVDDVSVPATLTFPAGSDEVTLAAPMINDQVFDPNESFTITIGTDGVTTVETFTGTILDDDPQPNLTFSQTFGATSNPTVNRLTEGENQRFSITRNGPTDAPLVVNLTYDNDPTADLLFFNPANSNITDQVVIPAGSTQVIYQAFLRTDGLDEALESFAITASAIGFPNATETLEVIDADGAELSLEIDPDSILEGQSVNAVVTRNAAAGSPALANPLTVSISANNGEFSFPATVTIPANVQSVSFTLTAVADNFVDGDLPSLISVGAPSHQGDSQTATALDNTLFDLTASLSNPLIDEGETTTLTVGLVAPSTTDTTVNLSSGDPSEATLPSSVVIPAGQLSTSVTVTGVSDGRFDADQTFDLTATLPGVRSIDLPMTVSNVDAPSVNLSVADSTIDENGSTTLTVQWAPVTFGPEAGFNVNLSVDDASELGLSSTTVFIGPGQLSADVTVSGLSDALLDGDQLATITATPVGGLAVTESITVTDVDTTSLSLVLDQNSISENGGVATGTLSLTTPLAVDVSVALASDDISEAAVPAAVVIPAGATSVTFDVTGVDDPFGDGDQTALISAAPDNPAVNATSQSIAVLDDDDSTRTVTYRVNGTEVVDPTVVVAEGDVLGVEVTWASPLGETVELDLESLNLAGQDAVAGLDFVFSTPQTVVLGAFDTTASFEVTITDDSLAEPTEEFGLQISETRSGSPATPISDRTVSIVDNDVSVPSLTFDNTVINENAGTATATLALSNANADPLTFNLTVDQASRLGIPASVTIPAGDASVTFAVTGIDNAIDDGDQVASITAANALVGNASGNVTVVDDDFASLSITPLSTTLSEDGAVTFTVSLDILRTVDTVVNLSVDDTGEAQLLEPVLVIPAGTLGNTFALDGVQDNLVDGNQLVTLTGTSSVGDVSAQVDVVDIDTSALSLAIDTGSIDEASGLATGVLTLTTPLADDLIVTLLSSDTGTATVDPTVTILAGQTSASFLISAVDDLVEDGDQSVSISALSSLNDASDSLLVLDNDTAVLSVSPVSGAIAENGVIELTASLSIPRLVDTVVNLAVDQTDEATVLSPTVTILAGQTSAPFTVAGVLDNLVDGTQTVLVTASSDRGSDAASIDVTDIDSSTLTLAIDPDTIVENGGLTTGTLSLSTPLANDLVVTLSTDGAGEAMVDASVTIPAGQTSFAFSIAAVDDAIEDGDQTVSVTASSSLGNASDTLVVSDDDVALLSITPATGTVAEGGSLELTVSLDIEKSTDTVVTLGVDDVGEASLSSFTVIIPAGQLSANVTLSGVLDQTVDGNQTVLVTAFAPGRPDANANVDVIDVDAANLVLSLDQTSISEFGSAILTVALSTPVASETIVNLATSDPGEATVTPVSIPIPGGQTSVQFTVSGVADFLVDGSQTVTLTASSPGLADAATDLTVTDFDTSTLGLLIDSVSISENGGLATGTLSLSTPSASDTLVTLASDDTGEASVPNEVIIPAGALSATFAITGVDDGTVDGTQTVTVDAGSVFGAASGTIDVVDDEVAGLALTVDAAAISESAAATGTVTLDHPFESDVVISLASSDVGEATVPSSVTVAAGQTTATFPVTGVEDNLVDGTQTIAISASTVFDSDSIGLDVTDVDSATLSISADQSAVSELGGQTLVTVSIDTPLAEALVVTLTSGDLSELSDGGDVVIPQGSTSATIPVFAVDDIVVDGDQLVSLSASSSLGNATTDVTVTDDEVAGLSLVLGAGAITESTATVGTVTLDAPFETEVIVTLSNGDPSEVSIVPSVAIPAGATSVAFSIFGRSDGVVDGDQLVSITAATDFDSDVASLVVSDTTTTSLTVTLNDLSISENGGSTIGQLDLTFPLATDLVVDLTSDASEVSIPVSVTVPAGQTRVLFDVVAVNDNVVDGDQAVTISASSGVGGADASVTVVDDEFAAFTLSIDSASIAEDGSATGTITLAAPFENDTVITLTSSDTGEATVPASVTIAAGDTTATFAIDGVSDNLVDGTQTVSISASTPFDSGSADLDVTDIDSAAISVSLDAASISELGGVTTATISIDTPLATDLVVTLASSDTTELADGGTVTIPQGSTSATLVLSAVDDIFVDGDQLVTVTASSSLGSVSTDVTVLDDEVAGLSVSLADVSINEDGSTVGTVTLDDPFESDVVVTLTNSDVTEISVPVSVTIPSGSTSASFDVFGISDGLVDGDQTASVTATTDFATASASVSVVDTTTTSLTVTLNDLSISENGGSTIGQLDLTFPLTTDLVVDLTSDASEVSIPASVTVPAGQTRVLFDVVAVNDNVVDGDQAVTISASSGVGGADASVTVIDDEFAAFTLSIDSASIAEDGSATGTITLAAPFENDTVITLTSSDPGEATVPASVTIAAGDTTATFAIDGVSDNLVDGTQTVSISASTPFDSGSANLDVTDIDSAAISVSLDVASVSELGGATTATISIDTPLATDLVVALASSDTTELADGGTVTIPQGSTSATLVLSAVDDIFVDGDQLVTVTASSSLGSVSTDVTVLDDDVAGLSVSLADASINEDGSTVGTVTLDDPFESDVVVTLTNSDVTEISVPVSVTIPSGSTSANFDVFGISDGLVDGDQTASVTATTDFDSDVASLVVSDTTTTSLTVTLNDLSISENGGSTIGQLDLTFPLTTDLVVDLTSDASEVSIPASVTVPAGQTRVLFDVVAVNDNVADGDQAVTISASSGVGGADASVTVIDDEFAAFTLSINSASIAEDGSATGTIALAAPFENDTVITLTSSDPGEATVPASVTIAAGDTIATFAIDGVSDNLVDGTQTVSVSASTPFDSGSANLDVTDIDTAGNNQTPVIVSVTAPDFVNKGVAGVALNVSGIFEDLDAGDTHSVTIAWGDGTTTTLAANEIDQAADSFASDHTYVDGGIYTATVTVDDGEDSSSFDFDVVVTGVGLTTDGKLQIVGTSGRDHVRVRRRGANLEVRTRLDRGRWSLAAFPIDSVASIDAYLCDGNDRFTSQTHLTIGMNVDGGGGNDDIRTGNGDDVVVDLAGHNRIRTHGGNDVITSGDGYDWLESGSGDDVITSSGGNNRVSAGSGDDRVTLGDGNDRVYGGSGNDLIIAGDGFNRVFADRGDDVLVGGSGVDWLLGGSGDDLLIGGAHVDWLNGGSGDDLLIAGETIYDDNDAALEAILEEWTGEGDYESRIESLRSGIGEDGEIRLVEGETVFADGTLDIVIGGSGEDWFFAEEDDAVFRNYYERFDQT